MFLLRSLNLKDNIMYINDFGNLISSLLVLYAGILIKVV